MIISVTVIIINWNGESCIKECLDSVLLTHFKDVEIIVLDNASTDRSLEILTSYNDRIKLIKNNKNVGFAQGNNLALNYANGRYIVTLNNDMTVEPNWLTDCVQFLDTNPQYGIISCRQMNYYNRELVDGLFFVMGKRLFLRQYQHGEKYSPVPSSQVMGASGGSAIFRRSMLDQIGFFDEDYIAYFEDSDLSMRAFYSGWKCAYIPTAVVYHKVSASFGKNPAYKRYLHERNRYIFTIKYVPIKCILFSLPLLLLGELKDTTCYFLKFGFRYKFFTARLDALKYILDKIDWKMRLSIKFELLNDEFKKLWRVGFIHLDNM